MEPISSRPVRLFGDPQIHKVPGGVHVATGFDLGNVIKIATAEGPVIVDTASTLTAASQARDALAEVSPGDARYVVYTHCHNDHTSGAGSLCSDATVDVIAQRQLEGLIERDHVCLEHWTARHRSHQRGRPFDPPFPDREYIAPSLTFDGTLDLDVGGIDLHLEHTEGETRDHLLVWMPESKVLCTGDLIYRSFPNLSTPAIGPRPIEGWIRSLERFRELTPEHLVPSHGRPVSGRECIDSVLAAFTEALQHVWDESLRAIDAGTDVNEAARTIQMPPHLVEHPWLQEIYGTVNWGVRAVYDTITGWYDMTPASLDPLPRRIRDAELVAAAGAAAILDRARAAVDRGDAQLALELTDVILSVTPDDPGASAVQVDACRQLRNEATSANAKGFYNSGLVTARRHVP
jgi:alkyl sulfatase BDS1-like metallo-beta-lactamase superfamily hydrolase